MGVLWVRCLNQIECRVDIVLLSGDFANIPVECYANNGPQEVFDEHRQHLENIVHSFAPIAPKVYYIPGNVRRHVFVDFTYLN